jgi:hypothetical protein
VNINTIQKGFRKARSTNKTGNWTALAPQFARPETTDPATATGRVAIDLVHGAASGGQRLQMVSGKAVQNLIYFQPYAVGADNTTASARVYGWCWVGDTDSTRMWIPVLLCEVDYTVGALAGVASKEFLDTERLADTVTLVQGVSNVLTTVHSPTGDLPGFVIQDFLGCTLLEFDFEVGTATSANALWRDL